MILFSGWFCFLQHPLPEQLLIAKKQWHCEPLKLEGSLVLKSRQQCCIEFITPVFIFFSLTSLFKIAMGVGSVLLSGCEPADWQTQVPMFCLPSVCLCSSSCPIFRASGRAPSCLFTEAASHENVDFLLWKTQSHSNSQNLRIRTD